MLLKYYGLVVESQILRKPSWFGLAAVCAHWGRPMIRGSKRCVGIIGRLGDEDDDYDKTFFPEQVIKTSAAPN